GAHGGYQLRRPPSQVMLSEVIRIMDGPLAPFRDVTSLQHLIDEDKEHRALYRVFMDVRNAAADILENTSLADVAGSNRVGTPSRPKKGSRLKASAAHR